jgi:hypothetical protein
MRPRAEYWLTPSAGYYKCAASGHGGCVSWQPPFFCQPMSSESAANDIEVIGIDAGANAVDACILPMTDLS